MSRILRLYPRAWRERYLAELEDLLADRPPTVRDHMDMARGALDAWIHPQLVAREPRPDEGGTAGRRFAAGAAVLGGGLWVAGGLAMNAAPIIQWLGYKDSGTGVALIAGGAVVSSLAAIALAIATARGSRAVVIAATAMLIGAAMIFMPWPFLAFGFFGYAVATVPFGLLLGRAGNQAYGALLPIGAFILMFMNTEDQRALLTIPFGLVWIAVGALALRHAPAATPAGTAAVTPA
jgi:hypothetical protein